MHKALVKVQMANKHEKCSTSIVTMWIRSMTTTKLYYVPTRVAQIIILKNDNTKCYKDVE